MHVERKGVVLVLPVADCGIAGGAGCFDRHGGPVANKQRDDADVMGIGAFVEEGRDPCLRIDLKAGVD